MDDWSTESTWVQNHTLKWYQKFLINVLKCGAIPQHVAFIMDGNRRYAKKLHIETKAGHTEGFKKLIETSYWCRSIGIKEITFYAFSIENFKRSKEEVDTLMDLISERMEKAMQEVDKLNEYGICFRIVGNLNMISENVRARASKVMQLTKDNTQSVMNIAFAYTSQDEIAHAMQTIQIGIRNKEIIEDDIDEYLISKCMYVDTNVDMMIRTSGEVRFSDFVLWQSKNANVLFRDILWPAFSFRELFSCIFYYQVHHGDQRKIEKMLKYDVQEEKNKRIETFLKNTETRKWIELETYASQV